MNCPLVLLMTLVTSDHATGKVKLVADHNSQSLAQAGQVTANTPPAELNPSAGRGSQTLSGAELALVPHALAAATS
jgi:hypothetical protein